MEWRREQRWINNEVEDLGLRGRWKRWWIKLERKGRKYPKGTDSIRIVSLLVSWLFFVFVGQVGGGTDGGCQELRLWQDCRNSWSTLLRKKFRRTRIGGELKLFCPVMRYVPCPFAERVELNRMGTRYLERESTRLWSTSDFRKLNLGMILMFVIVFMDSMRI